VDVTDRAALDRLAARVGETHGGLDVLVNAAGVLTPNLPAEQLPLDDFTRAYEVNVLGTVNACQALFPLLRARRGAIVNVASQAALVSLPQQAAYTAAKGAVAALTRSLAIDWAGHGIRANAVAPGFTLTPMTEAFFENETFTRAATDRIPLGRILAAEEIAGAIVFLASPLAAAVTGVTLPVDGGWTAGEPALPW
jgi:meso-butanediol dehydrogenase/(S,S)-butanediol dehydrogenase/diacetyl reductase